MKRIEPVKLLLIALAIYACAFAWVYPSSGQTVPAPRQVFVGNPRPVTTLADAIASIGTAGNCRIILESGLYVSAPFTINASNVTIEAADPNNKPVIRFVIPQDTKGVTFINGTADNVIRNIVFDVPNAISYALRPRGDRLLVSDCEFTGQGGIFLTDPGDVSRGLHFVRPKAVGIRNHYAMYFGGDEQDALIEDPNFGPSRWSSIIRVMRSNRVTIKGGYIRQDVTDGAKAQAVQLRGYDNLAMDGTTIDALPCGAFDIGCLNWQEPGNLLPNCTVKNCTINGYILVQAGANATFENNKIKAQGNGGFVFGMQPPLSGVHRPTGNGVLRGCTVVGPNMTLASHASHLKIDAGNFFNGVKLTPTPPTSNPTTSPTQPVQP